jgi:endogenous inhibitor of DNA gyrase (YacG/DUF329 family)
MAETRNTKTTRRCPICKAETVRAYQPFCSQRCADIDLGKWFTNAYAVRSAPDDDEAANPIKSGDDDDDQGS